MAEKTIRHIVRIMGKDLDGTKTIEQSLRGIKGISHRLAHTIAIVFEKETGIKPTTLLGEIDEKLDKKLEDIIKNPVKHNIPTWQLNRRKDIETGEDMHLVMADLDFSLKKDLQRLFDIRSYRGLRHAWGLPVRGQRTRTSFRRKGGTVGVFKKETKQAASKAAQAKQEAKKKSSK
ncbi:MAG: 30S ribosomal protein S13 [Candidatus Diapherotrites archaeon]|nr:30S ribosomal protein S13 [Candidatus Diapherotrites archaeon]